jgi:RNA polymerase sigma-70 factor (ECF subfamily)
MSEQDDAALFEAVYAGHHQTLHAYFFGRTGDPEVAADLVQETFLRAWRNIDTLRMMAAERHRYWLFAVGRNLLTDHYRRSAAPVSPQELADDSWLASSMPVPEAHAEWMDQLRQLDAAIRCLPDTLRTALAMQVLGEMTSAEIGEALNLPAGTVRYHLSQARRVLIVALNPTGSDARSVL